MPKEPGYGPSHQELADNGNKTEIQQSWTTAENQKKVEEMIERAKKEGDRVFEVKVNLAQTFRVPERAIKLHGNAYLSNIIYYQSAGLKELIDKKIEDGIREQDPNLIDAIREQQTMVKELEKMYHISYGSHTEIDNDRYEATESYDSKRADELIEQIDAIGKKYDVMVPGARSTIERFERTRHNSATE